MLYAGSTVNVSLLYSISVLKTTEICQCCFRMIWWGGGGGCLKVCQKRLCCVPDGRSHTVARRQEQWAESAVDANRKSSIDHSLI